MDKRMDFYEAMAKAIEGKRVRRIKWNASNTEIYVFARPSDTLSKDFISSIKSLPDTVKSHFVSIQKDIKFSQYLCLFNGRDMVMNNWHPSDLDKIASDWTCLD